MSPADLHAQVLAELDRRIAHADMANKVLHGHERPYTPHDPTDPAVVSHLLGAVRRIALRHTPVVEPCPPDEHDPDWRPHDLVWCGGCDDGCGRAEGYPCLDMEDMADAVGIATSEEAR